jgi:hypothetical protein
MAAAKRVRWVPPATDRSAAMSNDEAKQPTDAVNEVDVEDQDLDDVAGGAVSEETRRIIGIIRTYE